MISATRLATKTGRRLPENGMPNEEQWSCRSKRNFFGPLKEERTV